jgi:hypothetical protein
MIHTKYGRYTAYDNEIRAILGISFYQPDFKKKTFESSSTLFLCNLTPTIIATETNNLNN